jgi:hypothetical protein
MTSFSQIIFNDDFDEGGGSMWHFENGTQANQWTVGSATYTGTGGKAAYISNDGGTSNIYTISGATSVVHLYVDITFPECAGGMLSFDWKGMGQSSYDNLTVSVVEDTIIPVAGTAITKTTATIGTYYGKSEWQHVDYTFPTTYSNVTKRLVFTWKNNASSGTQPAMAIDNLHIEASPLKSKTVEVTVPGMFKNIENIKDVTHLKVTGQIDARDIQFMRDSMDVLMELDISQTKIAQYQGTYEERGTFSLYNIVYPANEMPVYSFIWYSTSSNYHGKESLAKVYLPNSLTSIGEDAFAYCSSLNTVTLPIGIQTIKNEAFYNCTSLGSVGNGLIVLNGGLTSIGEGAFYGCSNLTAISFPIGLASIGKNAFGGCSGLTEVILPAGLKTVGAYAFRDCSKINTVMLPAELSSIGIYGQPAFFHCTEVRTVINLNPVPITVGTGLGVTEKSCVLKVPETSANIYKNTERWANYIIEGYGLSFSVKVNNPLAGSVIGTESGLYLQGSTINIHANPGNDYTFINWTDTVGNIVSNNNGYNFALTQNTILVANFENTDATLQSLSVNTGKLEPEFNPDVTNYSVSVTSNVWDISISAVTNQPVSFVEGTGTKTLNEGINTFEIIVTAESGNKKTYTIEIERELVPRVPFTEDFETGGKMDWTISNIDGWGNKWFIGDLVAKTGNQAAYICYNGYSDLKYNLYSYGTAFLYCDVVFPTSGVSTYQLIFDWKGMGEVYNNNPMDYVAVYVTDTDITPVAGFGNTLSYMLSGETPFGKFNNSETWQKAVINLPDYSGQTKRLIFGWQNDNQGGTGDPIVVDNISISASGSPSSISFMQENQIKIFPERVKNNFAVYGLPSVADLAIYSLAGQKLLQRQVSNEESVFIANLPQGVYIIEVNVEGRRFASKIIKD